MHKLIAKAVNRLADVTGIRVLPDRLLHPREPNVQTLKVPGYVQSQPHTCGFVAALMILHYFRPDYPTERLYERIRPDGKWGVSRRKLADTLRGCKVRVTERRDLAFRDIMEAIDQDRPIALMVHTNTPGTMHWVVVYGYGRYPNRLYVAANGLPLLSRKQYPYGMFRAHFWAQRGFGLVCAGPKD